MRIRQMAFSSRLKAHRHILTLETLKFIYEYMLTGNAKASAINSGIPEAYASRQGQWLKKHPMVKQAMETELDERELRKLGNALAEIERQMDAAREILGINPA